MPPDPFTTIPASLVHPKHWASWILVFICYGLSKLSLATLRRLGYGLGQIGHKTLKQRRHICRRNIESCFPELSPQSQTELVRQVFISSAIGVFESVYCWWRDITPFINDLEVEGLECLEQARAQGRGVLIISGHFTIFDFAIPTVGSQAVNGGYMYRPNNYPVFDRMIERGRRRHFGLRAFNKRQTREMVQFLKDGGEVWYATDQDFGPKYSKVFVPFFNVATACITTPSRIARRVGCQVLQVSQFRRADGGYKVCFRALPDNFGQDEQADAEAWNRGLEEEIRKHPEQYFWMHKRFKTRPIGEPALY